MSKACLKILKEWKFSKEKYDTFECIMPCRLRDLPSIVSGWDFECTVGGGVSLMKGNVTGVESRKEHASGDVDQRKEILKYEIMFSERQI